MPIQRVSQRVAAWWRRRGSLGARGERAAARHLRKLGYRILARNLRTKLGEIDILAQDPRHGCLVVVEVKAASGDAFAPELHVNPHKRRKLSALASQLVRRYRLHDRLVRFDVVGLVWPAESRKPTRLTHHIGAFESTL